MPLLKRPLKVAFWTPKGDNRVLMYEAHTPGPWKLCMQRQERAVLPAVVHVPQSSLHYTCDTRVSTPCSKAPWQLAAKS